MLMEDITKDYKRCSEDALNEVNKTSAEIAKSLGLDNRMEVYKLNLLLVTLRCNQEGLMI